MIFHGQADTVRVETGRRQVALTIPARLSELTRTWRCILPDKAARRRAANTRCSQQQRRKFRSRNRSACLDQLHKDRFRLPLPGSGLFTEYPLPQVCGDTTGRCTPVQLPVMRRCVAWPMTAWRFRNRRLETRTRLFSVEVPHADGTYWIQRSALFIGKRPGLRIHLRALASCGHNSKQVYLLLPAQPEWSGFPR